MMRDVVVDAGEVRHEDDASQWRLPSDASTSRDDTDVAGWHLAQFKQCGTDAPGRVRAAEGKPDCISVVSLCCLCDVLTPPSS
jgi:hypothetical protein